MFSEDDSKQSCDPQIKNHCSSLHADSTTALVYMQTLPLLQSTCRLHHCSSLYADSTTALVYMHTLPLVFYMQTCGLHSATISTFLIETLFVKQRQIDLLNYSHCSTTALVFMQTPPLLQSTYRLYTLILFHSNSNKNQT